MTCFYLFLVISLLLTTLTFVTQAPHYKLKLCKQNKIKKILSYTNQSTENSIDPSKLNGKSIIISLPLLEYKVTADFAHKLHLWEMKKGLSHDVSNSIYLEAQKLNVQHLRAGKLVKITVIAVTNFGKVNDFNLIILVLNLARMYRWVAVPKKKNFFFTSLFSLRHLTLICGIQFLNTLISYIVQNSSNTRKVLFILSV